MFNLKSLIIKDNHIMVKGFIFISRLLFESYLTWLLLLIVLEYQAEHADNLQLCMSYDQFCIWDITDDIRIQPFCLTDCVLAEC